MRIIQNGDYWRARWTDRLGKRQSKNVGKVAEMSEKQANKLAIELMQNQPSKNAGKHTISTWQEKYLELRASAISEETLRLHAACFQDLANYFGEQTKLDKIDRVHAAEWRAHLGQRVKESTVCGIVARAKVIFSHAVDLELITENPFDRLVSTCGQMERDWPTIDNPTLLKIMEACPNDQWRMAFALARWAGLRINEIRSLKWRDIDWETRMITVRHVGAVTTKKRQRTCPIREELYAVLRESFEQAPAGSLGPATISPNNVYRIVDQIMTDAGLAKYPKPFHTLRKNCETEWCAKYPILDVTSWLGNSPTVAAAHYVRPTEETLARVTGLNPIGPKVVQS